MANEDPSKDKNEKKEAEGEDPSSKSHTGGGSDDFEISLDNLDEIIADEDPAFSDSMSKMQAEADVVNKEIEAEADASNDASNEEGGGLNPESIVEEDSEEKKVSGFKKILNKIFKPISFLKKPILFILSPFLFIWRKIKFFYIRIHNRVVMVFNSVFKYLKMNLVKDLKSMISKFIGFFKKILNWFLSFKNLTLINKLRVIFLIFLVAGLGYFGHFVINNYQKSLFQGKLLLGLQEVADQKYYYNPKEDLEEFYHAFPQPEYKFLLNKVVVNLTPERGHKNPMGIFEFNVSADSRDTAIEIKDREQEFIDLLQRTIEEMRYNELNTTQGLNKLKGNIKSEFNRLLNQGRVKTMYIKTMVLKP